MCCANGHSWECYPLAFLPLGHSENLFFTKWVEYWNKWHDMREERPNVEDLISRTKVRHVLLEWLGSAMLWNVFSIKWRQYLCPGFRQQSHENTKHCGNGNASIHTWYFPFLLLEMNTDTVGFIVMVSMLEPSENALFCLHCMTIPNGSTSW